MNEPPGAESSGAEENFGIIWHGQILDRRPYTTSTAMSSGMDTEIQKKSSPRQNSHTTKTATV